MKALLNPGPMRVGRFEIEVEQHATTTELRTAIFSPDYLHRYALQISWDESKPYLIGVCLNPSTATHLVNDPTVERCCRRALMKGYGGFVMLNAYAFRATDPRDMKAAVDPVGPANDYVLTQWIVAAGERGWTVMVGWGAHIDDARQLVLQGLFRAAGVQAWCLGVTKDGRPKHPLYQAYEAPFRAWPSGVAA